MKRNYPLSRKADIVIQEADKEVLIYDLKENKAFCLNETSALIWELCDGKSSLSEISQALSKKLKTPADEGLIWLALEQLKKEKLIENEVIPPSGYEGMSRREAVRKVGLASLIAIPVIMSLHAPAAAAAISVCSATGTCTCQYASAPSRMTGICGAPGVGGTANVTTCTGVMTACMCNVTNITDPNCTFFNTNCTGACIG